jgi:hypothetical protein
MFGGERRYIPRWEELEQRCVCGFEVMSEYQRFGMFRIATTNTNMQ